MSFNQIKQAIYALYLTNMVGFKLRKIHSIDEVVSCRLQYAETLLSRLNIEVEVEGAEKIEQGGQYLILSNHRSIIDPLIVEMALKNKAINDLWVSKKELYNSFFFGMFTRNAGSILLDREASQMSSFFKDVKSKVAEGCSISVFPEGTRNKTEKPLAEFMNGAQLIAVKNKLPMLPVYIKGNANTVLMDSLKNNVKDLTVVIEIGDVIDYKDRSKSLKEIYQQRFNIA